jgi:hypothetical protein
VTGLVLAALLGVAAQPGVVDRIEGEWALVEWPDRSVREMPVALFQQPPREGQAVRLWLLAHPRGPWQLVGGDLCLGACVSPLDFTIPAPHGARSDRRYLVVLTVVPPPEPGVAADHERGERVVAGGTPTQPSLRRRK